MKPEEMARLHMVGRNQEIQLFLDVMKDHAGQRKIINIYGTAGVGKSFLLDEFQHQTRKNGAVALLLDSSMFLHTPQDFCCYLLQALHVDHADLEQTPALLLENCIELLNERATGQQVVLLLDTYEQMEGMDHWLREFFIKRLEKSIIFVISGRYPLSEPWLLAPELRQSLTRIPIAELDFEAVQQYARYCHIFDSSSVQRIWRLSKGHPLTLSLVTFTMKQSSQGETEPSTGELETLPFIVNQWLREVPGDHLRPLVEAASVLRHFNQESLSVALGRDIAASEFFQLIRFSFVRKVDRGWTVHSLMRELITQELLARTPQYYEGMRIRVLQYYYEMVAGSTEPDRFSREAIELMYYVGDALIRAFMNWFVLAPRPFEPINSDQIAEVEDYLLKRKKESRDTHIELVDQASNQLFTFTLTAEQTLYTVRWLDLKQIVGLGYDCLKVLRDTAGSIIGLAVIIPINQKTLPYLAKQPRSKAYFGRLKADQRKRLSVPENMRAGWFIETIDTADFGDAAQQAAIGHLLHSLIFTGELLVESPAPFPYFITTHESLGFERAEHATHLYYDGTTPAPTFVLDTQGTRLLTYLNRMLHKAGLDHIIAANETEKTPVVKPASRAAIHERVEFTLREREVAALLAEGMTNNEIAKKLFLSEVTVKKHLKAMFEKLEVTNRTQLLKKLLES
ncbi:MAG: LuxR C-terminal-related transcriptional regulator [Clostridia bacterium]